MRYFDSRDGPLSIRHILASGALPPAFPAVRIDGELYWDGGILSNTPVETVFDDDPRRDSGGFAVHIWNPHGAEPWTCPLGVEGGGPKGMRQPAWGQLGRASGRERG